MMNTGTNVWLTSQTMKGPTFYAKPSLSFERRGFSVLIRIDDKEVEIDGNCWASAIASMCGLGEDARTFQEALNFHVYGYHRSPTAI